MICPILWPGHCVHLRGSEDALADPESANNPFLYRYSRGQHLCDCRSLMGTTGTRLAPTNGCISSRLPSYCQWRDPKTSIPINGVSVDLYEQVAIAYEGSYARFSRLWCPSGLEGLGPPIKVFFHVYVRFQPHLNEWPLTTNQTFTICRKCPGRCISMAILLYTAPIGTMDLDIAKSPRLCKPDRHRRALAI